MARRPSLAPANDDSGNRWYFSKKEIEENSPSRKDGIDLVEETNYRKSYCSFLQKLGMKLQVPQVTIATATLFCHRFFMRQSHLKHNWWTIATACMFLASKVEETQRGLQHVTVLSYEIIHKRDHETVKRMFDHVGFSEKEQELILDGEKLVLETLGFDLNVMLPYKPLIEGIKKFQVADCKALRQVAWNFVNDGFWTSLCLQFKPHQIAAGAIFLAAKFLKIKLSSNGQKTWWQELSATPSQLEEVSNRILELYDENAVPQASQANSNAAQVRSPYKLRDNAEKCEQKQEQGQPSLEKEKIGNKVAMEERRKLDPKLYGKGGSMDEDELIEIQLEEGIEI